MLNALLALAGTRGRHRLLLNGLAQHPDYRALLDALRLDYEDRGWMERRVYEETLSSVDLGLQLSFAESFDYVAAEHLVRGVPVLGSRMLPVLRALTPETRRALVVDEADEVGAIREALQSLLDAPERCVALGARARAELLAANETSQKRAREVLCAIAGEPEGRERR